MPAAIPNAVAKLFPGHRIRPEKIELEPEDGSQPSKTQVKVRALDGFVIWKDNKFVYPTYELSTPEWWDGVTVYGYTAALTGDFKYFIWSGHWEEDYPGKHLEVIQIETPLGMYKEASKHWRANTAEILWLESKAGFSYALLDPEEEYDRGHWRSVTKSWTTLPHPDAGRDPAFVRIDPEDAQPSWWSGKAGMKAWNHFVKPLKKAERDEQDRKRKKAKVERQALERSRKQEAEESAGRGKGKGKGKGKTGKLSPSKVIANGDRLVVSPKKGNKRKHEESSYDTAKLRTRKSDISYIEVDEDDIPEAQSESEFEEPPPNQAAKRRRMPSTSSEADSAMSDPGQAGESSTTKARKAAASNKDDSAMGTAPNTQTQLSQSPEAAIPSQSAGAGESGSSQPAKAMQGLSIGDSANEGSAHTEHVGRDTVSAVAQSDGSKAGLDGTEPARALEPQPVQPDAALKPPSAPAKVAAISSPSAPVSTPAAVADSAAVPVSVVVVPGGASPPAPDHPSLHSPGSAGTTAVSERPAPAPVVASLPPSTDPPLPIPQPVPTSAPAANSSPAPGPTPDASPAVSSALDPVPTAPTHAHTTEPVAPTAGPERAPPGPTEATSAVTASAPSVAPVSATDPGPAPPSVEEVGAVFEMDHMTGRRFLGKRKPQ
ncbi:hypothetical protein FRC11_000302 [Ceratobasidium sp. 423]|nr:hypothetical protein FRC11_000302 [Ceratobasidium sp. 423]